MTRRSTAQSVVPSINRNDPPDFWQMEWKQFEELTCAVLDKEPELASADLFHVDGQPQFGADSHGPFRGRSAIAVASSKCYKTIRDTQIKTWSDDFLEHYESFWKARNVRRFILAVASPVNAKKLSDAVEQERKRFADLGMEYEVWGPRQFAEKLRPHRAVVLQFMDDYWANRICGEIPVGSVSVVPDSSLILDQIASTVAPLMAALSESLDDKLESLRWRLREDPPHVVARELESMRTGPNWAKVTPTVRSKCLRYLASAKLQEDDLDGAAALADEADAISPEGNQMFRALLLARRGDSAGALRMLQSAAEPESKELKVAVLLQTGLLDEAEVALNQLPITDGVQSIEAGRLRAFLLLYRGRRADALAEIVRVEERAPRWFGIRRTGAIVRYANALSSVCGEEHFASPAPIAAELVREDDYSQKLLNEARITFDSLAKDRRLSAPVTLDEVWALASECNLLEGSGAAQARCNRLLALAPSSPEVISWALARGLNFDREHSLRALKEKLRDGSSEAAHVLAYSWLLSLDGNDELANEILVEKAYLFVTKAEQAAYAARLRFSTSASSAVPPTVAGSTDSLEQQIFEIVGIDTSKLPWEKLEAAFVDLIKENPTALALLAAASRLAAAGRWKVLAEHTDALLEFGTASAVEIAVHAAYNCRNSPLALQIMMSRRNEFPRGNLPRNLRVIEARALAEKGEHQQAVEVAEALSRDFDESNERLLLADIRLAFGDIRGAVPIIRREASKGVMQPQDALRWARIVANEDPELARKLVKQVRKFGVPSELVFEAHAQAERLGLQQEAVVFKSAVSALIASPGAGGLKKITMEEFQQHQASRAQDRLNIWSAYLNGGMPFHVTSQAADIDFGAHYYLGGLLGQGSSKRPPLLIRHGARAVEFDTGKQLNTWRLYLDVSSLLLASQLEILQAIEESVAAIVVPRNIQRQLIEFADSLEHPQPARLRLERQMNDALLAGTIQVWRQTDTGEVDAARAESGLWRVTADDANCDEDDFKSVTVAAVVEGLRRFGQLDDSAYEAAIEAFGRANERERIPELGARVLFPAGGLELVALKCPLISILRTYVVFIDENFAEFLNVGTETARTQQGALRVVNVLREHIADQLLNGNYESAPEAEGRGPVDGPIMGRRPLQILGLLEFLRCPPDADAVFCCDDRYVTGFPAFGTAPVIGVFEVLRSLRTVGRLSEDEYFGKLIHLRIGNAMFLPIEAKEVVFHLERAPIVNGRLTETPALTILKRYVARVALMEPHVKIGNFPEIQKERPDETAVLMANRRLTDDCLAAIWTANFYTDEQCQARADWIWSNLRLERHLGLHPSIRHDESSVAVFVAITSTSALTLILQLAASGYSDSRRSSFSQWLLDSVIKNRFRNNRELKQKVVAQFGTLIDSLFLPDKASGGERYSDAAIAIYCRNALGILPEDLREQFIEDKRVQRRLAMETISVVTLNDVQLRRDKFISAVRKAIRFGSSEAKTQDTNQTAKFQALSPIGTFAITYGGRTANIFDKMFCLFEVRRNGDVKSYLEENRRWFDCNLDERSKAIETISRIKAADKQYDALDTIRRRGLALRYQELEAELKERNSVPLIRFASPRADEIYRHLRLGSDERAFSERWLDAAKDLIADCGLAEGFLRLGCLPVPLPPVFVESLAACAEEERTSLYTYFVRLGTISPVHYFHLLSLMKVELASDAVRASVNKLTTDLLGRWGAAGEALGALLSWVDTQAHVLEDWHRNTVEEQLVSSWYHATRLICILNSNPGATEQIRDQFGSMRGALSADSAFSGLTRSLDCASADTYMSVVMLYGGVSYAVAKSGNQDLFSDEQWQALHSLTRVSGNLNPWLYPSRESSKNELDSFLRVEHPVLPESVAIPQGLSADFEADLLKEFESARSRPMLWIHLYTLARLGLSKINRDEFAKIVSNVRLPELAELDDETLITWRAVAGCVNIFGGAEARRMFVEQIHELAKILNERFRTNETSISIDATDERGRRLHELLEASILFSRGDDVVQAYRDVSELLSAIAFHWPTSRSAVCRTLETIYDEARTSESGPIWHAIVSVRSQA